MKTTFLIVLTGIAFVGCAGPTPSRQEALAYPYVASRERQAEILNGMDRIKTGMTPSEVKATLGKTDFVYDLFNRGMKDSSPIGYTWWYILQRKTDTGSFAEREEKLVRVSFDLEDTVTKVDFWGIDKTDNK
jgi:hypothetical protein